MIKHITVLLYTFYVSTFAQKVAIDNYSTATGLSNAYVSDIKQDSFGYLWIATHDGLNRFDGRSFKVFTHDPGDSNSLAGNWIDNLLIDSKNRIWCSLGIGGVSVYNAQSDSFIYFDKAFLNKEEIKFPVINLILQDSLENTWIFGPTYFTVIKLGQVKKNYKPVLIPYSQLNISAFSDVIAYKSGVFVVDDQGNLWHFENKDSIQSQQIILKHNDYKNLTINSKINFVKYFANTLYAGTDNSHFYKLSPVDKKITLLAATDDQTTALDIFSADSRLFMVTKTKILTSDMKGLKTRILFDSQNFRNGSEISHIYNSVANIFALINNTDLLIYNYADSTFRILKIDLQNFTLTRTFLDFSENIFLGTQSSGLIKISPKKNQFEHFGSGLAVTDFIETDPQKIMISTINQGLWLFDSATRTLQKLPGSLNGISALLKKGDELFAGSFSGNIHRINKNGIIEKKIINLNNTTIQHFITDSDSSFWIATATKGLVYYNFVSKQFIHYLKNQDTKTGPSSPLIWHLLKEKNRLWIGTAAGGLNLFDPLKEQFTYFIAGEKNSINNLTASFLFDSGDSLIWIGTYSGGINWFNKKTGQFNNRTIKNGLSGNMINGILRDDNQFIWLATNKGLSRINPQNKEIKKYALQPALQNDVLVRKACLKIQSGELFFGLNNGFIVFNPLQLPVNKTKPRIVIEKLNVITKMDYESNLFPLNEDAKLEFPYNYNVLEFWFNTLEFTDPAKNRIAYKLQGLEESWRYTFDTKSAIYSNLAPDNYRFSIKAANNDDLWSKPVYLNLTILPPFWRTSWFIISVVILVLVLLWQVYRYNVRKKIRESLRIEQIRQEEQSKIRLSTARDFHDELGHNLTRISLLSQNIKASKKQLSKELLTKLDQINTNAEQLYNGARDFIWAFDPGNDLLVETAIHLKDFGDDLFSNSEIDFRVQGLENISDNAFLSMNLRRNISLLFKEAMNNTLKHARAQNAILSFEQDKNFLKISFKDDGEGFELQENSYHLGLKNMKMRAEKLNGQLSIVNKQGTAVELQLQIPQTR